MPYKDVSVDFILGLPGIQRGHVSIMIVGGRFSKMAYFVPCHKNDNASHIAHSYFKETIKPHGVLRSIISDQDTKFLGGPTEVVGGQALFGTTCHPQTVGQMGLPIGVYLPFLED